MRFNNKDKLVAFVNQGHVDNHFDCKFHELKLTKWDITCKEKEEQGCNRRLGASKKKLEGIFAISMEMEQDKGKPRKKRFMMKMDLKECPNQSD